MLCVTTIIEPPHEDTPQVTSLDGFPELATNDYWRAIMRRARGTAGFTQSQLGARVGVSQNVISKIESGEQRASTAVIPICNALKIAPPIAMIADELDARWFEAGQRIRRHDEKFFRAQVEAMERMVVSLGEQRDT